MAGAAPQAVAGSTLAPAHRQLLGMAVDLETGWFSGYEVGNEVRETIAGTVVLQASAGSGNTGLPRKVALRAYGIAARWWKPGRIDHIAFAFDMQRSRPVASLASYAVLGERRLRIGV